MKKKYIYEAYRGSISHNLYLSKNNDPEFGTCDIDMIKIYCFENAYYLGLDSYYNKELVNEYKKGEQDIVEYELRKCIHLLRECNPNMLVMLWNNPRNILKITKGGKLLIKNRKIFLSRKLIRDRFIGYANAQLKYMKGGAYKGYMGEKRKRITKKYGYDSKNAMHLIRLLDEGINLLKTGILNTWKKGKERELLLSIKRAKFSYKQILNMSDELFKKVDIAYKTSKLPDNNNYNKINKLLLKIISLENR